MISTPQTGYDLSGLDVIKRADIIHIHWVAGFLTPITLKKLVLIGKPVVLTCHDQRPFTGGCHCVGGCLNFAKGCFECPQLNGDSLHIPHLVLKDQLVLLGGHHLAVVTPSRWLENLVRKSALFCNSKITKIPNSVDTDALRPMDRKEAKKQLGLDPESIVYVFGAASINEKIKGFRHLARAFERCMKTSSLFRKKALKQEIVLLTFGNERPDIVSTDIKSVPLGYINSLDKLRSVYEASDFLCLPSLEDNFPNTMIEAMSCGVPVIAYNTGGIPEMVRHGETGLLAPTGDVERLAECIVLSISKEINYQLMSSMCRETVVAHCSFYRQAQDHLSLYRELLKNNIESEYDRHIPFSNHKDQMFKVPVDFTPGPYLGSLIKEIESASSERCCNTDWAFIVNLIRMAGISDLESIQPAALISLIRTGIDCILLARDLQRLSDAEKMYQFVLSLYGVASTDMVDTRLFLVLGMLGHDFGDYEFALTVLDRAIAIDPGNVEIQFYKGVVLREHGCRDEALDAFERAVGMDRENIQVLFYKGVTLRECGRLDEALEAFNKAAFRHSEFYSHIKTFEGAIFRDQGRLDNALNSFREALAAEPGNLEIRKKELDILINLECYEEAMASINRGLVIDPNSYDLKCLKAKIMKGS